MTPGAGPSWSRCRESRARLALPDATAYAPAQAMSEPRTLEYTSEKPTMRAQAELERGIGLPQAVALNISNMVGIGPFITIPLFVAAMGGPQAMIAWVI